MRLVRFQCGKRTVYINPERVCAIEATTALDELSTEIYFSGEDSDYRVVDGNVETTARKLTVL